MAKSRSRSPRGRGLEPHGRVCLFCCWNNSGDVEMSIFPNFYLDDLKASQISIFGWFGNFGIPIFLFFFFLFSNCRWKGWSSGDCQAHSLCDVGHGRLQSGCSCADGAVAQDKTWTLGWNMVETWNFDLGLSMYETLWNLSLQAGLRSRLPQWVDVIVFSDAELFLVPGRTGSPKILTYEIDAWKHIETPLPLFCYPLLPTDANSTDWWTQHMPSSRVPSTGWGFCCSQCRFFLVPFASVCFRSGDKTTLHFAWCAYLWLCGWTPVVLILAPWWFVTQPALFGHFAGSDVLRPNFTFCWKKLGLWCLEASLGS